MDKRKLNKCMPRCLNHIQRMKPLQIFITNNIFIFASGTFKIHADAIKFKDRKHVCSD